MAARWGIFSGANYAGVDQGVDFTGAGPIPALDAATVTDVGRASIVEGGSYPYVVYRLNAGPYRGDYVYLAENFNPTVHKGQKLRQGQAVGMAAGQYPYIEIGFNKTATGWNATAPLGGATPAGQAMKKYIYGLIGSAAPVTVPDVGATFSGPTSPNTGVTGAVTGAAGAVGGAISSAEAVGSFLGKLTDPHFWLRAIEVIGGTLIALLGLYLLAKAAGLGDPGTSDVPVVRELAPEVARATGAVQARWRTRRSARARAHVGPSERPRQTRELSESGERRAAIRARSAEAGPSNEIPF